MNDARTCTAQRTLEEARANDFEHAGRGMTLGSVIEHRDTGGWGLVTDIRDDGRVRFLNLEEVPDADIATLEEANGCVEHARIGRGIAARHDGVEYHAPPEVFDVLGPVHPEYQRGPDK
jgi:hypothetical protein